MNSRPSEFSIIKKYFAPFASQGAFEFRDDASEIIPNEGKSLVITQDAIAEGIHFFSDDPPELIAKKALRVNLSDLAAKGATPKYISLALGLGKTWNEQWVAEFANGLKEDCEAYDIQLTGGDTFSTGAGFVISITALGEVPHDDYVSRLNAKAGDTLFVTGEIGDAALGLLAHERQIFGLKNEDNAYLINRYLLPQPRVAAVEIIREFASASMDISDGLIGDLEKLCQASEVGAALKFQYIPFSQATQNAISLESNLLETALTGGDDYEILFTVAEDNLMKFEKMINGSKIQFTRICTITSGQGVKVFDRDGQLIEFEKSSYDHSGDNS
jgi:thiamine-monophosphate kinase